MGNIGYPMQILQEAILIIEEAIGRRVRLLRESHGMTQEELGAILGLKKSAVERIESGMSSNLRADKIKLLCETFHEYPGFLLYGHGHDYWRKLFSTRAEAREPAQEPGGDIILLAVRRAVENTLGSEGIYLLSSIRQLNDAGLDRAKSLIDDLTKIDEYLRRR